LDYEWNVGSTRHFGQREAAVDVRERIGNRLARSCCAAKIAGSACGNRVERRVRHVDEGIVNGVYSCRIVDSATQAGRASVGTIRFDLALYARATRAGAGANIRGIGSTNAIIRTRGAALDGSTTAITNGAAVLSAVRSGAAARHAFRIEAEIRHSTATARSSIRAGPTLQNATAAVTYGSAILPAAGLARRERHAIRFDANADFADLVRGAGRAIQDSTAAIAEGSAKFRCSILARVLLATRTPDAGIRLARPVTRARAALDTAAAAIANCAAVLSTIHRAAAFRRAIGVEADMVNTTATAEPAVGAITAAELAAASIANCAAISAAHRFARERDAPGFDANAVRTRFAGRARAAVQSMPTAIAYLAAELSRTRRANRRWRTRGTAHAEIVFAGPTGGGAVAAVEAAIAAVANLAAVLPARGVARHGRGTGNARIIVG